MTDLTGILAYHVDVSKGSLIPVEITLDPDYFQMKLQKMEMEEVKRLSLQSWMTKSKLAKLIPFQQIKDVYSVEHGTLEAKSVQIYNNQPKVLRRGSFRRKHPHNFKLFAVVFGNQFKLKKHYFLIVEHEPVDSWISETKAYLENTNLTYFQKLGTWYKKQYDITISTCADNFRVTLWKQFLYRNHVNIATIEMLELLPKQYSVRGLGALEKYEFDLIAKRLVHSGKSIELIFGYQDSSPFQLDIFKRYSTFLKIHEDSFPASMVGEDDALDDTSPLAKLCIRKTAGIVIEFNENKNETANLLRRDYLLCSHNILDYLFSEHNSIWDPQCDQVWQDMDQPLSHYWIASSHNTYLTGNQYHSPSSVDAYARVLRQGCRCIEIDVWNGPCNKPIVTHGRTLTSTLPLKAVLETIKQHAFATSSYPLIISIENHCSVAQQRVMAKYFRRIFGPALISSPEASHKAESSTNEIKSLPSPNQLKNKIILKGRKLPCNQSLHQFIRRKSQNSGAGIQPPLSLACCTTSSASSESRESSRNFDVDEIPFDCLATGELWRLDENDEWVLCIFILTNTTLFYVDKELEETDGCSKNLRQNPLRYSVSAVTSNQDLHTDQLWYHVKIVGGTKTVEKLLEKDGGVDGRFLVRKWEKRPGEFVLSLLSNGEIYHYHIYYKWADTNEKIYSLKKISENYNSTSDAEGFTSVYSLIEHYREHGIIASEGHALRLQEPIPLSTSYEDQEWFYKRMTRANAEKVLESLPVTGLYLVRYSETSSGEIVISFRIHRLKWEGSWVKRFNSVIIHCRIKRHGRFLTVANQKFSSLEILLEHYSNHKFYRNFKLSYPVGKELFQISQQMNGVDEQSVAPSIEFISSTVKTVKGNKVRAIQSYKTRDPELLSFSKGDIIIDVVSEPGDWWWGRKDPSDPLKQFCSSFVEKFEELDFPIGADACKGTFRLGVGVKVEVKCCTDKKGKGLGMKYYLVFKDLDGTKRQLGASCSKRKVDDWVVKICEVVGQGKDRKLELAKAKASMKHNIAAEYSDLIVYCCAMDMLNPEEIGSDKDNIKVTLMKSLDDVAGDKLLRAWPSYFVWYHKYALTRIYPNGFRLDSSNFRPALFWNNGVQMVALNYQTPDKPMQWNRGKFRQNGNCGYVLKPEFMICETEERSEMKFDPIPPRKSGVAGMQWALYLGIEILSGRHLEKDSSGPISPLVEIEVIGVDADCKKVKTHTVAENGLNPYWNYETNLPLVCPELALVQFTVYHEDSYNDKLFLGESTIPVPCMQEGFRSIQLLNGYGEPILSSLLVKMKIEKVSCLSQVIVN